MSGCREGTVCLGKRSSGVAGVYPPRLTKMKMINNTLHKAMPDKYVLVVFGCEQIRAQPAIIRLAF